MTEELAEGQVVERDEAGRFVQSNLTSERAREIAAQGARRKSGEAKAEAEALAEALSSVLVSPEDPRADALRLLITQLSRAASKDSQSSIRAVESALSLVGERQTRMEPPRPGQVCKLCGLVAGERKVALSLSRAGVDTLRELVAGDGA